MLDTIIYFKQYLPTIKTLRTHGLTLRHWRAIGNILGFSIDPSNLTFFKIISLDLFKPEKLKQIQQISDMAAKEYAVQLALEQLLKEIKRVEFEFETASDGTYMCKNIP